MQHWDDEFDNEEELHRIMWDLVRPVRTQERKLRADGAFNLADRARQMADAFERHTNRVLGCEWPNHG